MDTGKIGLFTSHTIAVRYREGESGSVLAAEYGVHMNEILDALSLHHVKTRTPQETAELHAQLRYKERSKDNNDNSDDS